LVKKSNHKNDIEILIGDNCSGDRSWDVIQSAVEHARKEQVHIRSFRNSKNLRFGGNIREGLIQARGKFLLFLSDDDNIIVDNLDFLFYDLYKNPSSIVYNFFQEPFYSGRPNIEESFLVKSGYVGFERLIRWPKLSGIVINRERLLDQIPSVVSFLPDNAVVPHVTLVLLSHKGYQNTFFSTIGFAQPDDDFKEHINFISYVGNYIQKELFETIKKAGIEEEILKSAIANIEIRNIVDTSLNALIGYYKGQRKITRTVRKEYRDNLIRFVLGFTQNSAKLPLKRAEVKYARMKSMLLWFLGPAYEAALRLGGRSLQLMKEGF
jgi:glycosyltransferase involved in cell wall biosynthesis